MWVDENKEYEGINFYELYSSDLNINTFTFVLYDKCSLYLLQFLHSDREVLILAAQTNPLHLLHLFFLANQVQKIAYLLVSDGGSFFGVH